MFDLFGADLPLPVKAVGAFVVVLGLILAATWLLRRFGGTRLGTTAARGRQPRLAVIDAASVDARRRLVLIRRDNVEHLVLIGGPTDIVVEQNIVRAVPVAAPREAAPGRPHMEAPPPREAPLREPPPRPEPRSAEPNWTPQPEPAPRMGRSAEPRSQEPAWTPSEPPARPPRAVEPPAWVPQPEPAPRQSRPAEPKAPVDLPPRPLPEPVTAALRAASSPERPAGSERAFPPERTAAPESRAARPAPVRAPAPPPPPPAPPTAPVALEPEQPVEMRQSPPTADVNLADMAQRLEAALRRPAGGRPAESRAPAPRPEPRPPREASRPTPPAPAMAAPAAPASEPRPTPELPRAATIVEPPPAPAVEPSKPVEAQAEPKPAPKSVFDSLEEEMANLLGKPAGKP
jgi:flagellar protein FliO/FliZ